MPQIRRALREDVRFTEQCQALGVEIRRLDEITQGARDAAMEDAEEFPTAPGTPFRGIAVGATALTPALRIYFTISDDDGFVDFHWLEVLRDDPDEPML